MCNCFLKLAFVFFAVSLSDDDGKTRCKTPADETEKICDVCRCTYGCQWIGSKKASDHHCINEGVKPDKGGSCKQWDGERNYLLCNVSFS